MLALVMVLQVVVGACGDNDDGAKVRSIGDDGSSSASGSASGSASASGTAECEPVGDIQEADTRVDVRLDEWVVDLGVPAALAGKIGFVNENIGEEPHELVVVDGVTPTDLPLDDDGALDEAALPDGALVGEVEAFPAGQTCDGVFELDPGEYTLLCNIVETEESGEVESHLKEGMVTTFTVT
ncbi:MAG: hypothetical protein FJW88_04915 [Actinobacteria bacterium]|nr:hypothetical protein [Actinomycetota bacterium]